MCLKSIRVLMRALVLIAAASRQVRNCVHGNLQLSVLIFLSPLSDFEEDQAAWGKEDLTTKQCLSFFLRVTPVGTIPID